MFCAVVCCAQGSGCRSLSVMLQKTKDDKSSVMLSNQSNRNSQHQTKKTALYIKTRIVQNQRNAIAGNAVTVKQLQSAAAL